MATGGHGSHCRALVASSPAVSERSPTTYGLGIQLAFFSIRRPACFCPGRLHGVTRNVLRHDGPIPALQYLATLSIVQLYCLIPTSCTLAASVQRLDVGPQRLERNQDAVHRRMSKGNPIRSSYSLPSLAAPLTLHIG